AAVTLLFVMRAKVEGVYMSPVSAKHPLKLRMDCLYIGSRIKPQRHATLIRYHYDPQTCPVEPANGLRGSGQHLELAPGSHILPFRHLFVQNAIAIEEDSV
ncbi:MAG: hypothetical protein WBQ94_21535, partial [Terracidiphilus sp.]